MDRSNVSSHTKQTHLRQSFVFNTGGTNPINRSFINTSLASDSMAFGDDLRKSRIQNLPNYKKSNLGENIQFISVFQTIEIERLANEVEVLRIKIKEYERQLFNASNYEVQIRELTERCFSLEREREEYRDEMEKLNKICETLYHENEMLKGRLNEMDVSLKQKFESEKQKNAELMQQIEKWKSRYQASEKSRQKELDELRNMMECQRKSMIDREIREMTIRFQNERSSLENEIRKGREQLENRNRQIEDYRQKVQRLDIQVMELRNYESTIAENENKIAMMGQEMMRLNSILKDKEDEIHGLKQREQRLNQQMKELGEWEHESKRLKSLLENKAKEIEEWKVRSSRLEDEVVRAKELSHYVSELQNKLDLASSEIERYNGVVKSKLSEVEHWKKKFSDKEFELEKLRNLEHEIHSYETKLSNMKLENDRINGILKSRLSEIEEWKSRHGQMEAKLNEYGYVEKDKKKIEEKFNHQIKLNEELKFHVSKLENDLNGSRRFESRANELQQQNGALNKEIERLNNTIRSSNNEIKDYKTRHSKLEATLSEYKNIQMQLKDFEHKIIMLTQEIERLNQLINEKNAFIGGLEKEQIDLHSKINHYKGYESKIQESESYIRKYQDQVANVKRELDTWQRKAKDAENRNADLDANLFQQAQEREKLSNLLKTKSHEFENVKQELSGYEAEARKAQMLKASCEEMNNHIMGLVGDIEGYQRNQKGMEAQLEKQREFTNEFAFKIIILSAQVERLSKDGGSGGMKSKEFLELQESYSRLQNKVRSKNNEIDMLQTKISNLESRISQMAVQFNRLLSEAQRSEQETQGLIVKINEYQDYAKRIHILGNEIDQLNRDKYQLSEEVKAIRLRYSDNIKLEERQTEFYLKYALMAAEIENLRSRVDERKMSEEEMRKSYIQGVRHV